jgi:hypothetical protein
MARRAGRTIAFLVVCAEAVAACGGGGGGGGASDASSSTAPPADTAVTAPEVSQPDSVAPDVPRTVATDAPESDAVPPLLEGGVVSDAALAAVLTPDGVADTAILQAFAAELAALPLDEQEAVIADLSLRTELAAAAISGLEAAVGDRASVENALVGAGSQVQTQIDADAAASLVSGLRHGFVSPQAPASAAAVAATGLFLGYMALATFAKVATEGSNTIKPGEDSYREGDGMTIGANLEEVDMEIKYKGDEDGVDVDFVASVTIHPCPAADGTFTLNASIDVKASKGGAGQNANMELTINGTVDDNAELADKNIENHTQWSDFGGGKGQFIDFTFSGENGVEQVATNRTGGTLTNEFTQLSATLSSLIGLMIGHQMLEAAEQGWKSGRCVELKVTPSAGPGGLSPSEVVNVLAEPRSKVDGSPTGGNVTATLSAGGASVEPNGSPVAADANSNYTAPAELDKTGTVSYESRSRRGVGKADITFSTSKPAAYQIAGGLQDWQVNQVVCDVMKPFTLESPGIGTAEFSGGLSGSYSVSGIFDMHYEGTYLITLEDGLGSPGAMVASSGGTVAGQAGSGSENYVLTPATC